MNYTEKFIMNFYRSININDPPQISIEYIVDLLDIKLTYWRKSSALAKYNNRYCVFINENLSVSEQWQDFGHEMYHYFYDETNYSLLNKCYADHGESKADYFAYHFCVPTFMLLDLKEVNVYGVMELFNVEFDFALRRLEMYEHRVLSRRNHYG